MTEHLWPYLRLKAESEEELKEKYRQVYIETYVRDANGKEVEWYEWGGKRVRFNTHAFDHAFSESSNYKLSQGVHDILFSKKRARCILWIKEVLIASAGTIERRVSMRRDSRNRIKKNRVLLVVEEKYVVILEEKKGAKDLYFITAYPADKNYIESVIRKDSSLIEIKKAPVLAATEAKP